MRGAETTTLTSAAGLADEVSVVVIAPQAAIGPFATAYVTDANVWYASVAQMASVMISFGELPPLVVVGVGYPIGSLFNDDDARAEWGASRQRDLFAVTHDDVAPERRASGLSAPGGVGAGDFLAFLTEEVAPFVERSHPAHLTDRALVGASVGADFALYALLARPGAFQRVVAISPGVWPQLYDDLAVDWADSAAATGTDLFIAGGSLEENRRAVGDLMIERLQSIAPGKLRVSAHTFENETHASVWPAAYSRGLRTVYASGDSPAAS